MIRHLFGRAFARFGAPLCATLLLNVAGTGLASANTCLVTPDGNSTATWTTTMTLQAALGDSSCTEIWVAAGVYKPVVPANVGFVTNDERLVAFNVPPGFAVYGGFAGNESLRKQRNPAANITILSGDIDNNDANAGSTNIDQTSADIVGSNSVHVVFMDATNGTQITDTTVLDGFTITGGEATDTAQDGGGGLVCNAAGNVDNIGYVCSPALSNLVFSGNSGSFGGGAVFEGGGAGFSSPTLSNVTFSGNSAAFDGGAMYNDGHNGGESNPILSNVTFSGNSAIGDGSGFNGNGGAMFNNGQGGDSDPILSNVTFSGNSAYNGGAMVNYGYAGLSNPRLSNVTFSGNSANNFGGAMGNNGESFGHSSPILSDVTFSGNSATYGGAMYNDGSYSIGHSSPSLDNVTFSGNSATYGGAMFNNADGGNSAPTLINVILWNDTATNFGPEIANNYGTPSIDHSVVQGDCPIGSTCTNLVTTDPLLGPLGMHGGSTATMLLGPGSSAIDTGDDTTCTLPPVNGLDQRGVTRPQGPHCDIGAVEARSICRVTVTGTGGGTGTWASPMDLQTALGNPSCTEIWVKAGAYKPTSGTDRTVSFNVKPGVAVFGGFAGNETNRDARNPAANVTILSGDIDNNDANAGSANIDQTSADIVGSNSYNVVIMNGGTGTPVTDTTVLDGFTITGGEATGALGSVPQSKGSGLFCYGGNTGICSPTLSNLTFSGNLAYYGGAMYNDGQGGTSSPILSNVTFSGNGDYDTIGGGAMYNDGNGGTSSPILSNVTFSGNSAGQSGGAMYNDGTGGASSPNLRNVTFSGNSASDGGAIYLNGSLSGVSSPILSNVILWGDTATTNAEISNASAIPSIDHSVVEGSGGSSNWTGLGTDNGGNIDADPLLGPLGMHGGSTATMLLGLGSSAIDAGNDTTCTSSPVNGLDQRGVTRPQGPHCDIGAVEAGIICRVTVAGTGGGTGTWAAPMDLQTALGNPGCAEIWVKAGVYKPTTTTDRTVSFNIMPEVAVYGGFAGNETLRGQRNPAVNVTILSGDIGNDDANAGSTNIDQTSADIVGSNSYHVVLMDGATGTPVTDTTVLDGFTITGGQANGSSPDDSGGGLYCYGSGSGDVCSPGLSNLTFSGNSAGTSGGAIYDDGTGGTSSPTLSNITFSGNSATQRGGAMENQGYGGASSPILGNVTFSGNSAFSGGAMYNDGESSGISSPALSNVTFRGNSAYFGGAMYNDGVNSNSGASSPSLSNVILWGDTATLAGPEIYNNSATASIDHSVVQGSGGSGNWTGPGTDNGGNIDADPLLGPLGMHGGSTATMVPGAGGSAVDTGNNATCAAAPVNGLDQRGVTRPQGPNCDIGAVEYVDVIFANGFEATP